MASSEPQPGRVAGAGGAGGGLVGGALQLPREMTEPLGMRDLVRLESEPDHIGVWPDRRDPE